MELEEDKLKHGRGGPRKGAGRPNTGRLTIYKNTTISGKPEEIEALKKKAEDADKSLSRYILDELL